MPYLPDPTMSKDIRMITPESVVFLGDSLTHIGWWRKWYPTVQTGNAGWGGDTTARVLLRLDPILEQKPKKIFLLIGGNDYIAGYPHYMITAGQRLIIDKIKMGSPQTELYVQSVFPFGENIRVYNPAVPPSYVADIRLLNAALKLVCEDRGVPFLNTYKEMSDPNGYLKREYTLDQLHLEKPGYDAWVKFLEPYVTAP
jgi:lysophospholipase L1-like esterase